MPKRTSTNTETIRQEQAAGFAALLQAQRSSLSELQGVRKILELSRKNQEHANSSETFATRIQVDILGQLKEHTKIARQGLKSDKDMEKVWKDWDKDRAAAMKGMQSYKSMGEKWSEKMAGLKEKYSPTGLKKSFLNATNVFGVNNKALEFEDYKSRQKALGADQDGKKTSKEWKADYEEMRAMRRKSNELERKIAGIVQKAGPGQTEETVAAAHGENSEFAKLLASRNDVNAKGGATLDRAEVVERSLKRFDPSGIAPEPKNAASAEDKEESDRKQDDTMQVLKKIEENTASLNAGDKKVTPVKTSAEEGAGGGLMSSVMGLFGDGFLGAIKTMFKPANILKFLGKAFAITAVIGSLFEGITDAFTEFAKSGSITKAIVAGIAGIVDFLTFGMFDKEKIKEVVGDMSSWVNDHIIKPLTTWISDIKNSIMSLVSNIGIPEIKFNIPYINKEVSVGPFYPFKNASSGETASPVAAVQPSAGNTIISRSAENEDLRTVVPRQATNTVVSAPTTNNNTTTNVIKAPIRNQESSVATYNRTLFTV